MLDYNTYEAANGKEALDVFLKEQIDMVISDIRMPVMNGIELMRLIKSYSPRTPVLMMSGYRPTGSQQKAMATKADGYILKPFDLYKLKTTLHQVIKKFE